MRRENADRSVCKNRSRGKDGGCNALASLHPYAHCFLGTRVGTAFDIDLPPRLPGVEGWANNTASISNKNAESLTAKKTHLSNCALVFKRPSCPCTNSATICYLENYRMAHENAQKGEYVADLSRKGAIGSRCAPNTDYALRS